MATIKLDNIAATASITLQLIKDYSMYDSEIISSNGTIFQSTDTETALSLNIYKGIEDITYRITDIVWTKFHFEDDELIEDLDWGKDKFDKHKVMLYKDELNEKSIIQASGYSMIEGKRELVTTARITIIKISDVYVSDIAPAEPSDGMMWMDTNKQPPVLKLWNNKLKIWESTGTDIPIIKNLIRNSIFWTNIDDYYTLINKNNLNTSIVVYQNKNWLCLKADDTGGVSQAIQYPIIGNSNYVFSFIAYRDTQGYNGSNINIKIIETYEDGSEKIIANENKALSSNISTITVPFITSEQVNGLTVSLSTESNRRCSFNVTELSLYNSSLLYPWELCPDDVDKQINNKIDNNRLAIFNTLTDYNNYKAIYESNSQYYIRSEYIVPAVASADDLNTINTTLTQGLANTNNDLTTKYNDLLNKYNNLLNQYNNLNNSYTALSNTVTNLIYRIETLENNSGPTFPGI